MHSRYKYKARHISLFTVGILLLLSSCCFSVKAKLQREDIEKAQKIFHAVGLAVKGFVEEVGRHDTLGQLNEMSKYLSMLGPVAMAISSGLSSLNMVIAVANGESPGSMESAEMKFLRDKFDKMESELKIISNGIEDLKVIVEKSSARAAYIEAIHTIENLYQELEKIQFLTENSTNSTNLEAKISKKINMFKQQFISHYNFAAKNIWHAFTVPEVAAMLKFDLLYLYRRDSNCNAMRVRQVCITVTQLLNKGMYVEAAYAGYDADEESIEELKTLWTERMERFSNRCDEFVKECTTHWESYAIRDVERVLYEDYRLPREILVQKIFTRLSEFAENRSFFVVLHDYITRSDSDKSSEYIPEGTTHITVRNVKDMDVHVFSKPLNDPPAFNHIQLDLNRLILEQTCFPLDFTKTVADVIKNKILSQHQYNVLYVVKGSTDPHMMGTINHFTLKTQNAGCLNKPYHIYVYG